MLSGVVTDFSEIKQEDGKRYFVLYLLPGDAYDGPEENIQVTVREAYVGGLLRGDLMRTRDLLRPFCMVNITEVEAGSSSGLFHTSSSSLIVIEPDYLVDVTDIASCFASDRANPNMFLLSKFSPDRDSEAMFKGTLINDLLDAYLKDEETDPVEVFRKALSKNLLKAARYGGQAGQADMGFGLGRAWEKYSGFCRQSARPAGDGRAFVHFGFVRNTGASGRVDGISG